MDLFERGGVKWLTQEKKDVFFEYLETMGCLEEAEGLGENYWKEVYMKAADLWDAYNKDKINEGVSGRELSTEVKDRYKLTEYKDFFKIYLTFHSKFTENIQPRGVMKGRNNTKLNPEVKKEMKFLEEPEYDYLLAYSQLEFHKDLEPRWNVIVSDRFWEDILQNDLYHEFMMFYYKSLIHGHFQIEESICNRFGHMEFVFMFNGRRVYAEVFADRIPLYTEELSEPFLYKYRQYLKINEILAVSLEEKHKDGQEERTRLQQHKNKGIPFTDEKIDRYIKHQKLKGQDRYIFNLNEGEGSECYNPTESDLEYMKNGNTVYVPMMIYGCIQSRIQESMLHISNDCKDIISDSDSHKKIIKFFEGLEKYGITFSQNQRNLLVTSTNSLVLGRSGTGKTTISAFKILALDLLFIAYKKKFFYKEDVQRLESCDFDNYTGCYTVFCTASPVLTNEVKRFYNDLLQSIKNVLKIKEEKAKHRKEETKEEPNQPQENMFDPFEGNIETQEETKDLKDAFLSSLEKAKEDLIEDINIEKQLFHYNKLDHIPKNEFPLFLTVKKLVYMLDGNCSYSFFARDQKGKIIGMDSTNEWHNEDKEGALMINRYQKDAYDFDKNIKNVGKKIIQVEEMQDQKTLEYLENSGIDAKFKELEDLADNTVEENFYEDSMRMEDYLKNNHFYYQRSIMSIRNQMYSQEVDFEMFERKFWKKNLCGIKLSALNVWTEIFSVIKGGVECVHNIISWDSYCKMKSPMDDYIDETEKYRVYLMYLKYEQWKGKHHYYDFMDVVRHVFKYYPSWKRKHIDYLVIDEVQDLAPLTIQLLLLATQQNIFFLGDTAQTIAKGVAFRFYDLKTVFSNLKYLNSNHNNDKEEILEPKVIQLTKNYRSHNSILQLANSIVDIIELYFPHTIDKLQRESSDKEGPKPIILEGFDHDDLEKLVMSSSSGTPNFGCNQVVIVRNQEMKNKIPFFMKKALCLTVYEAKGLEFDDVILYDFFTESQCTRPWRIINDIEVEKVTQQKLKIQEHLTIEELDFKKYNKLIHRLRNEEYKESDELEYEEVSVLNTVKDREDVDRNFGILNNELKYLYVSVTRPKTNLIIYDSDPGNRKPIYDYWTSLELVDVVTKEQAADHPVLSKAFEVSEDVTETKSQWRALGIKLFKKKYYQSVIKCFEESGDEDLKFRTLGYMSAEEATTLQSEGETLLYQAKHDTLLTKHEKRVKKVEGSSLKERSLEKFKEAGEYFEKIDLFRNAAQCFFTIKDYNKAAHLFELGKQFQQAAECNKMIGNFTKAARMFEECGIFSLAFENLLYSNDYEGLLECIHRNKDKFYPSERISLINKYVPIALNLVYQTINEEGIDEENQGKILQLKYKKSSIEIIKEVNSEYSSDSGLDSDEEELDDHEQATPIDNQESNSKEKEQDIDKEEEELSQEEELIDTSSNQPQLAKKNLSSGLNESNLSSFDMISKGDFAQDFEHLSNFDPDDDFLNSEKSFSIIGSVLCKDEESLSEYSDFSIVSGSRISEIRGANELQQERDFCTEDFVIKKIIYYVCMFGDEIKEFLSKIRSKEGLIKLSQTQSLDEFLELELDNIDTDMASTILDILEHFGMFRLCFIMCNRYNLKEHISRYLTSTSHKYSNLRLIDMKQTLQINDLKFRTKQVQVNALANEAIHNMLNLVDSSVINQQCTEDIDKDTKLLGTDCWRYIYYLGFWKKLIYLMDTHNSLKLCFSIGAFEDFKTVYLVFYRPELTNDQIKAMVGDPLADWVGVNKTALVEYLCRKVALEESMATLNNSSLHPSCECNINLNNCLRASKEGNQHLSIECLCKALEIAEKKLAQLCNKKSEEIFDIEELDRFSKKYYDNSKFMEILLPLFDVFLFCGRFRIINSIITSAIDQGYNIRIKILKMTLFIADFLDDPSQYLKVFGQTGTKIALQGILIQQKIRIPEPSDLLLNSCNNACLHRESALFNHLSNFVADLQKDKYNREFYRKSKDYFKVIRQICYKIPQSAFYYPMKNFEASNVGINNEYDSIRVADLEAEYISCPIYFLVSIFKKSMLDSLSYGLIREKLEDIPIYEQKGFLNVKDCDDIILPDEIRRDYRDSLELYSTLKTFFMKGRNRTNSSLDIERKYRSPFLRTPVWIDQAYQRMAGAANNLANLINSKSYHYFIRYDQRKGQKITMTSKNIDPPSVSVLEEKFQDIFQVVKHNLETLTPLQKTNLTAAPNKIHYHSKSFLLDQACILLEKFINPEKIELNFAETSEMLRFSTLIQCVFVLNKIQRLDFVSKYYQLASFNNVFDKDSEGKDQIHRIKHLVDALEYYQVGKWDQSVISYSKFLNKNYQILRGDIWISLIETAWYLAVVTYFGGNKGGLLDGKVYLPSDAFNYVHENCDLIVDQEDPTQNYNQILEYVRNIDIEKSSSSSDQLFIQLIANFVSKYDIFLQEEPQYLQRCLIGMFNMIGTLITNCEKVTQALSDAIASYSEIITTNEVIKTENIDKFCDYFEDRDKLMQFKSDFFQIEDYDKNDTLYHDPDNLSHNQFLVILSIVPSSENPQESVDLKWEEYTFQTASSLLAFRTLQKSLKLKVKNYLLKLKTEKAKFGQNNINMNEHNWISLNDFGPLDHLIHQCSTSKILRNAIEEATSVQNKLYNIFLNHYTIQTSSDTHFIASKLSQIEEEMLNARIDLAKQIYELDSPSNNESNDESFNPFIEIGGNNEEVKFVSASGDNSKITDIVNTIATKLLEESQEIDESLSTWLTALPEPELLSISTKQSSLKHKLRWEKMLNSKQKLRQLRSYFRNIRAKR
ncbi:unnamed protein product [Moneuplotes crassus]|uniref:UvrD-like helicase ATP-binding domain-containing protein n=1 Tax=Euplotes crassus TaxID=5936 RepID=A0AAD1U7U8_EUPCR|nr:unnamed protein product [Moneuplotes crassus]